MGTLQALKPCFPFRKILILIVGMFITAKEFESP
jgi:hypothetical protein